jgi:solute carrier family 24 (sodium/potassium/calcium exchanger), member 6
MAHVRTSTRGRRLGIRPFYITVLLISVLAAYSYLIHTQFRPTTENLASSELAYQQHQQLLRRSKVEPPLECNDVHKAKDQCAFVKQYCAEDEVGLISYIRFYYCAMGDAKPVAFMILVAWLGLLFTTIGIAASDFFSVNLSTIATILGLSESLAGVTFLAFGNGSPDVFSTFAAMGSNSASMALGELIGAACFISGVVAGSMALVREFRVDKKTYARDIGFFILAVVFTMGFLADGSLRIWECWLMIGYYALYVLTVVTWHWYSTRRKRRMRREGEARSHFYGAPGTYSDELAGEPYRDDPEDVDAGHASRTEGSPDISVLEQGPRIEIDGQTPLQSNEVLEHEGHEEDEPDDEHERMVAAEVASSMRVLRTRSKRSNTINPIRPSLVGALEFRSALAQLQRESNLKLSNMHGRSYSEANLQRRTRRGNSDAVSDMGHRSAQSVSVPDEVAGRTRALSAGDQAALTKLLPDIVGPTPQSANETENSVGPRPSSPGLSYIIDGSLAPPPATGLVPATPGVSLKEPSPQLSLQIPSGRSNHSGASSPNSPFPMYTDSPGMLTPQPNTEQHEFFLPGPAHRDRPFVELPAPTKQSKPVWWWPYAALPPPHVLFATLFPTVQGWKDKTIWDKVVSALSVPSVLLLVITLPVVESETTEDDRVDGATHDPSSHHAVPAPAVSIEPNSMEPENEWQRYRRHTLSRNNSYHSMPAHGTSPVLANMANEDTLVASESQVEPGRTTPRAAKPASDMLSNSHTTEEPISWNRWLICLQLFTGPLFSVFILWANLKEDLSSPGRTLVQMLLYTLLGSLVLLACLLLLTSEHRAPKYHYLFCFMGFIISIAWISTIAGEVVGVLKTFGVILGISEALLGLTIFAAGNSVGDLIADITIARLGYPVMAL